MTNSLQIAYRDHDCVQNLIGTVQHVLESVSSGFDNWEEDYVLGPGLYFAIVSGRSVADYADPMGDNRWPVEECSNVFNDVDEFYATSKNVAKDCDGGIVISVNGQVMEQMVRFRDIEADTQTTGEAEYASWMGSRHMSAADTSTRPEVVATLTLSEETGRVTRFIDGEHTDWTHEEVTGKWMGD